jgi:Tfp pilus assembly protein PilX
MVRRIAMGRRQHGVAALVVTMGLFFAMLLIAVFANRNLVFEQRSAANQYRATQAFEAAEAGLEWAQAQLNSLQRLGADCHASTDSATASFRERYLRVVVPGGAFSGATWNNAGAETALQPTCLRTTSGWACSCPSAGHPDLAVLPTPADGQPAPAFTLEFLPGAQVGIVRVVSRGCASLGGVCAPGSGRPTDATARVEVALALLPGLASAPAAPLTARGAVNTGPAAVLNADIASSGIAVHSGGAIDASGARIGGPAGAPLADSIVGRDAALGSIATGALFRSYFGLDRASWTSQPVVAPLVCSGNCGAALVSAVSSTDAIALIHVSGDLQLQGPLVIGSPQQPVLIVADGSVDLRADVTLYGLLYGASVSWSGAGSGPALLRGALISEAGYQGDAAPDIVYDAAILARLRNRSGTFARVSGSWRDF